MLFVFGGEGRFERCENNVAAQAKEPEMSRDDKKEQVVFIANAVPPRAFWSAMKHVPDFSCADEGAMG